MPTGKGPLRVTIEDFLETFAFGALVSNAMKFIRERDESEWLEFLSSLLDLLLEVSKSSPQLQQLFTDVKSGKHQLGETLLSGLASSTATGASSAMLGPVFRAMNAQMETKIHSNLPDLSLLLDLLNRKFISKEAYEQTANWLGYHPAMWDILREAAKPRLGIGELLRARQRYPQAEQYYTNRMLGLGWDSDELNRLISISRIYPSPQDLISFAVRETFDEAQAEFLGLDANFPDNARVEAEKSGLAEGWFRHYWRAHWQLPPATLAFEMYHRFSDPRDPLHITEDDLGKHLRALDIAPRWHPYYLGISTNLLTRVDVRRIWKAGIIDSNYVYWEYRRSGYDDFRAKAIVKWLEWENNQDVIDLTKSEIEKGYKLGTLSLREANDALKVAEPNEKSRQYLFALWDTQLQRAQTEAELDLIEQEYLSGQYTEIIMMERVKALGLTIREQKTVILSLDVKKRKSVRHLSVSQLTDLYELNQYTKAEVLEKLIATGYQEDEAKDLVFLIDIKAQKTITKDLETARKEQERLEKAEVKDQKAIDTGAVAVQIAELNAQIADIKVTANTVDDPILLDELSNTVLELKRDIAILNIEKAQVTLKAAQATEAIGE